MIIIALIHARPINSLVFSRMFPDRLLPNILVVSQKNPAYLALFGIGPYYSSDLFDEVKKQERYVLFLM